jgi:hypothetical protein
MTDYFAALASVGLELRYGVLLLYALGPLGAYVFLYLAYRYQARGSAITLPFDWLIAVIMLCSGIGFASLDVAATSQWAFYTASTTRTVNYISLARDLVVVCRYDPATRSSDELAAAASRLRRDDVIWHGRDGAPRARPTKDQQIPCDEFATLDPDPFSGQQAALARVATYSKPLGALLGGFAILGWLSFIARSLFAGRQRKGESRAGVI